MEHLWKKKASSLQNKKIYQNQSKKSNFMRFFDICGLVSDVRQFNNKLERQRKTALLFSFVSYPNFF